MKAATVALVVSQPQTQQQKPSLVDIFSDEREIAMLETAFGAGEGDPLKTVYEFRERISREDDEFGDYVEELLSQPFLKPEIQQHGLQWLRSKMRIEQYQRNEAEAARIIAEYALKVYLADPGRTDFLLAGPHTQVRIRVFVIRDQASLPNAA